MCENFIYITDVEDYNELLTAMVRTTQRQCHTCSFLAHRCTAWVDWAISCSFCEFECFSSYSLGKGYYTYFQGQSTDSKFSALSLKISSNIYPESTENSQLH